MCRQERLDAMSQGEGDSSSSIPWPPIVFLGGLALGFVLQAIVTLPWLSGLARAVLQWFGVAVIVAALGVAAWAFTILRRRQTTVRVDRPSAALVADGPYRFSRNPIYTAMVAFMAGSGLAAGNLWLILLAPVAALLLQKLAIEPEERHLQGRFGDQWLACSAGVRRWM
jgi:protein-S-isoprenylcysteine O-methyltransferase Ste14